MSDTNLDHKEAENTAKSLNKFFVSDYDNIRKRAPGYEEDAKRIDEFIARSPKFDASVYRGMSLDKDQAEKLLKAKTFDMNGGMSSWSSDQSVSQKYTDPQQSKGKGAGAGKVSIELRMNHTNTGTAVSHLSIFGMTEAEVLLPSTARFRVVKSKSISPLHYVVDVEEV